MAKQIIIKNAIEANFKDGMLYVTIDEPSFKKFKDGDMIISKSCTYPIIYRESETDSEYGVPYYVMIRIDKDVCFNETLYSSFKKENWTLATPEQRQQFSDVLKEHGLKWNPILKRCVKWQAPYGEYYYYISSTGVETEQDLNTSQDAQRYAYGNYFASKEKAEEAWRGFLDVINDVNSIKK